jgi:hypothetical protein
MELYSIGLVSAKISDLIRVKIKIKKNNIKKTTYIHGKIFTLPPL